MKYLRAHKVLLLIIVLVTGTLIAGCGMAPALRKSERLIELDTKIRELAIVYRKIELRNSRTGLPFTYNGNGFFDFGKHIISESTTAFSKNSVIIADSQEIEPYERLSLPVNKPDGTGFDHFLFITPIGGGYQTNSHVETANFVFGAKLVNIKANRTIWEASFDTTAWSGSDFLLSGTKKTFYDKEYAIQLLHKISDAMRNDGVI